MDSFAYNHPAKTFSPFLQRSPLDIQRYIKDCTYLLELNTAWCFYWCSYRSYIGCVWRSHIAHFLQSPSDSRTISSVFLTEEKSISNFWNSYLSFPPKLWPLELWSLKLFCPLTVKLLELASQSAQCINSNRIFVNSFETCHHERNQNSRKQFTQTFV